MTHKHTPYTVNKAPQMGYYNIERSDGGIIGRAMSEEIANHFAAAPELLEKLRHVEAWMSGYGTMTQSGMREEVRAAITKAEGQS